jgi:hypothetical protein
MQKGKEESGCGIRNALEAAELFFHGNQEGVSLEFWLPMKPSHLSSYGPLFVPRGFF